MNALENILQPVTRMMNRQIAMKTPARELCEELQGKVVGVRVRNTALAMYFRVESDEIYLSQESATEPDAAITGSLLSLAMIAGQSGEAAVRDGSLDLSGDAEVARSFQKLIHYGRPDLEEELSAVVGDVAAHGLGDIARQLGHWSRQAGSTLRQNFGEYLQEESRAVPTRFEVDALRERVEVLRDDVARADARLKQLESQVDR